MIEKFSYNHCPLQNMIQTRPLSKLLSFSGYLGGHSGAISVTASFLRISHLWGLELQAGNLLSCYSIAEKGRKNNFPCDINIKNYLQTNHRVLFNAQTIWVKIKNKTKQRRTKQRTKQKEANKKCRSPRACIWFMLRLSYTFITLFINLPNYVNANVTL